jgi:hypothetical protein
MSTKEIIDASHLLLLFQPIRVATMSRQFGATTSVLDMFEAVLGAADRWLPDDAPDVVPVVATDLLTDLPLIEQIARHAGAPVLIANSGTNPAIEGVEPSTGIDVLQAAIEAVHLPIGRLQVARLAKNRVAVRIEGEPLPTNPGLRNMLGALTSMLDANLAGQRLAVVVYDESNVDKIARAYVWPLLMKAIPACGAAMPRTLLVIIGNEDLSAEHYDADPSVRYILRPTGLLRRHSKELDDREIAALASGTEPLVLFLGAGSSFKSGLPLGNSLRDTALRNFFPDESGASIARLVHRFFSFVVEQERLLTTELSRDEQYFIDNLTLERVLREEKHQSGLDVVPPTLKIFAELEEDILKSPSGGIKALRELVKIRPKVVIATVNFDRLVEDSDGSGFLVMRSDQEFLDGQRHLQRYLKTGKGLIPLLKLHGSIEEPSTIVADVETTALGLSGARADALSVLVGQPEARYRWVYVGYSMRDPDVMTELGARRFAEGTDERWVAPTADQTVEQVVKMSRIPFWTARGVVGTLHERMISQPADYFFSQLLKTVSVTR